MAVLREFISKDTCNRDRLYQELECPNCFKTTIKQKRQVKDHFCSSMCRSIHKGTRIKVICSHCGKEVYKQKSKLENSRSGHYFCNRICKEAAQKYLKDIQPDHYGTSENGLASYRTRALKAYPHKCSVCGYDNIDALEVHHIDKNRNNNELTNLVILCANCHTLLHKNKL